MMWNCHKHLAHLTGVDPLFPSGSHLPCDHSRNSRTQSRVASVKHCGNNSGLSFWTTGVLSLLPVADRRSLCTPLERPVLLLREGKEDVASLSRSANSFADMTFSKKGGKPVPHAHPLNHRLNVGRERETTTLLTSYYLLLEESHAVQAVTSLTHFVR